MDTTENNLETINDNMGLLLSSFGQGCGKPSSGVLVGGSILHQSDYEALYENHRFFQNLVNLIPEDANQDYPRFLVDDEALESDEILKDLLNVKCVGEYLEPIDIRGALLLAGVYSRLYGDAFIFLGIDDGQKSTEPVDWDNVKGLKWAIVRNKYEVGLDYFNDSVDYYSTQITRESLQQGDLAQTSQKFHISRIIRFEGTERHGEAFNSDGFNMSVIDGVFHAYKLYMSALTNGADMLDSHSAFKFGIKGLSAKATKANMVTALRRRFENILDGIRIIGGVMYDQDLEEAEYIQRSYSGVNDLMNHLQEWLLGTSGMPRHKLFGASAQGSLSEGSEGEARQWAETIERYRCMQVIPAYEYLTKIILAARKVDTGCRVEFEEFLKIKPIEEQERNLKTAQVRKTRAEEFKILIESGVYTAEEVRAMLEEEEQD